MHISTACLAIILLTTTSLTMTTSSIHSCMFGAAASPLMYPDNGGFGTEPAIPWLPEDDQIFDGIPE